MHKVLILILLINVVLFGGNQNPCLDKQYLELKKSKIDDLSKREFEVLKIKEEGCLNAKVAEINKSPWNSVLGKTTVIMITGIVALYAYLLVANLGER